MDFHSDPACDSTPLKLTEATFFPDGFLTEGCVEGYGSLFSSYLSWG
jgi:hypothetical protein